MAYIGKSPDGTGVRARYYFTATGGETSLSGADDNAITLSFSDGAYVDVYLNGLLLVAGTDYNTTTANTISGLAALAANDIVEILVYDIFTVADTVSASAGGTFSANVAVTGDLTVDTDTLFVDASTDKVGINEATPSLADLEIYNSTEAGGTMLALVSESNNTSDTSGYTIRNSILMGAQASADARTRLDTVHNRASHLGADFVINSCTSGGSLTEKARILANGGITFNGDTATANALDDYEEGTFTPTWSSGSASYQNQYGYYTKVGNVVHFNAKLSSTSVTSMTTAHIDGLPFTSKNATELHTTHSVFPVIGFESMGDHGIVAQISPNTSRILLYFVSQNSNENYTEMTNGHIDEGGTVNVTVTGFYYV